MKTGILDRSKVRLQYELIKEYRKHNSAVVDTQGAESHFFPGATTKERQFKLLVSLLLSVQNNDRVTDRVMRQWETDGLSIQSVSAESQEEIRKRIASVNHNAKKSAYIKELAETLLESDVPVDEVGLCRIRGVGPKIANLFMQIALGEIVGVPVDTHCHRIPNRLRWFTTSTPLESKRALEELFDQSEWGQINKNLVGFGQNICRAIGPRCELCPISHLCVADANFTRKRPKLVEKRKK